MAGSQVWTFYALLKTGVELLGADELKWEKSINGIRLLIPIAIQSNPPCEYAWSFHISNL